MKALLLSTTLLLSLNALAMSAREAVKCAAGKEPSTVFAAAIRVANFNDSETVASMKTALTAAKTCEQLNTSFTDFLGIDQSPSAEIMSQALDYKIKLLKELLLDIKVTDAEEIKEAFADSATYTIISRIAEEQNSLNKLLNTVTQEAGLKKGSLKKVIATIGDQYDQEVLENKLKILGSLK